MKYTEIKGEKGLKEAIADAIQTAASAREKLQNVLVAVQAHYLACGDYTLINSLISKVDELKGFNAQGMIEHTKKYMGLTLTPVVVDEISGKKETPKGFNGHSGFHNKDDAAKAVHIADASATMWWDCGKQKSAFDILDEDAMLNRLMDKIQKRERALLEACPDDVTRDEFLKGKVIPISAETKKRALMFFNLEGDLVEAANELEVLDKVVNS